MASWVESTAPILVARTLVSQDFTDGTGDPSSTIFPAIDQDREDYLVHELASRDKNHVVVSLPEGAALKIDGNVSAGGEMAPMGGLDGKVIIGPPIR